MNSKKNSLFITGASGFIGQNLLRKIDYEEYRQVFCLVRKENDVIENLSRYENVNIIKADISESEIYSEYLKLSDIVIHLAALTGKAARSAYFKVNSEGTRILLEQCAKSNIKRFLFISSIAAEFQDIKGYHYAESKIEAERHVIRSGLPYTILRPTIVIGIGSPILDSFLKLIKAPITLIFGDGDVKIQPVFIDDLTDCILEVVKNSSFLNQTLTVAGPEQITMKAFIRTLHKLSYNKKLRLIHLPVRPIKKMLLLLENKYLAYLPLTAGQLSSFTNDGISDKSPYAGNRTSGAKNIDEMIKSSLTQNGSDRKFSSDLERECRMFTNYLINQEPDTYILNKYRLGNEIEKIGMNISLFDSLLINAAQKRTFLLKLADAYTSFFYKNAAIRKKLIMLVAILECCASTYNQVDFANERSRASLYLKVGNKAFVFLINLVISIIVFLPMKLYSAIKTGSINQYNHG